MTRAEHTVLDYSATIWKRGDIFNLPEFSDATLRARFGHFEKTRQCPYCAEPSREVLDVFRTFKDITNDDCITVEMWGCPKCGWWSETHTNFQPFGWSHVSRTMAILRRFDASDVRLPLAALRLELNRHPEILYDIHSRKFEELVADVVSDYYSTEVSIVGRTGDGGIDLVYLDGDVPSAVQVKRRRGATSVETVLSVREFIGALMIEGFRRGTIVTTAREFSRGAHHAKTRALQRSLLDRFDLIDVSRFLDMFRFKRTADFHFPWQGIVAAELPRWQDDDDGNLETEIRVWNP